MKEFPGSFLKTRGLKQWQGEELGEKEAFGNVKTRDGKDATQSEETKKPENSYDHGLDEKKSYTVGEWLDLWYEIYSKPNLRKSTQIQYKYFLKDIVAPRIGDFPIEQFTGLRLQQLYQDLRINGKIRKPGNFDPGLSSKTVRSIHMLLHCSFNQAVREGIIPKDPTDDCKPPKVEKREIKVIQPDQVSSYLHAAAKHNVLPMFYLELTSGLRRGELLVLL